MSADIRSNSPKKEFLYALGGVALFLTIVLIVGISAFLRPAGQHITVENTEVTTVVDEAEVVATEDAPVAAEETEDATASVTDAAETPAEDAAAAAPVATDGANDTVDQAAVADADLTAEQADGDLEAGDVEIENTEQ